ncbi:MAG TPA: A/G-specific adenine glycosylase [Verrucomicrobiae bacterium]|nr:A/G-specific adenine glycosylase [Verrucomicrobiae bacterium]
MQRERRSKSESQRSEPATTGWLVPPLLAWFRHNARDLPWRRTTDPYAIWISEIMLQQTQVKTVIPYWERWMRELPTVQSLVRARPERVLKLWEGLGYYTRARNLQRAAAAIVTEHAGRFPNAFDEVLALPGIGRYTAGAICSIAFNQPVPILDGNVVRVLARLFGIREHPREKDANARFWKLAETLVREAARARRGRFRNCSDLNQALMELGAIVCTSRQPNCPACPVRKKCVARREGRTAELPALGRMQASIERRFVAFVVQRKGRFLVRRRSAGVVNGHLWEFPNGEVINGRADIPRLAREIIGPCRVSLTPCLRLKHTITRYRITVDVFRADVLNALSIRAPGGRWCSPSDLEKLAFPSAHRRIVERIGNDLLADPESVQPPVGGST